MIKRVTECDGLLQRSPGRLIRQFAEGVEAIETDTQFSRRVCQEICRFRQGFCPVFGFSHAKPGRAVAYGTADAMLAQNCGKRHILGKTGGARAPAGRLESKGATKRGGTADRAAAIGGVCDGYHAGGDRGCGTT